MSKNHFRLFLALIAISILLMVYQTSKGTLQPLGFLMHPLISMNDSIGRIRTSSKITLKTVTLKYEELQALKEEIGKLKIENQRLTELELENQRLRELLPLKEIEFGYFTSARVIARGSNPWSNMLIIDKGRQDSLRKDMVVITPMGLAGKIHAVYESYSSVLLIDDVRFKAGARLQAGRAEGIFSGRNSRTCGIDYVNSRETVKEGEVVVTSGLDGIFPPGLNIGYVSKVMRTGRKLFLDIDVIPFVDTRKIEEVVILQ